MFCPKNIIFGVFCPKMAIFDIFWASKDDILPLLLSDIKQRRHFAPSSFKKCHCLPQKRHFWRFLPKNGHFWHFWGKQRWHFAPSAIRYQAKTTFCPFIHQKMSIFAPKTSFSSIFAQKWPFLTFLVQAKTTFCPYYHQISSKGDILPLHH